jgi:putative heme transporter
MDDESMSRGRRTKASFSVPRWLRQFGLASWLILGILILLAVIGAGVTATRTIVVPGLFAALLGATFLPLVDRLERWHVKRWIGALLVTLGIVAGALLLAFIVGKGVLQQFPTIGHQIDAGVTVLKRWVEHSSIDPQVVAKVQDAIQRSGSGLAQGILGGTVKGFQSLASLVFGIFIAFNILVYLLINGRSIGRWISTVAKPVPQPVAYNIIKDSARFLRGYIWGSTVVGLFNGLIVGVGAAVIGVPLAFTIGIVNWATNYIPMFGALLGGAFSVMIALGVGGWQKALVVLILVIVANGPLQNVVSQFALGGALKLNGLVILFVTTIGAIAGGAIGGIFAAPFTKIALDGYHRLKDAGLFDDEVGGEVEAACAAPSAPTEELML